MATATLAFLSSPHPPKPPQNPNKPSIPSSNSSRRQLFFSTASLTLLSLTLQFPIPQSSSYAAQTSPSKSILSGIANTKSWFQFFGSGFAIRVPPEFEDMTEPDVCIYLFGKHYAYSIFVQNFLCVYLFCKGQPNGP